MLIRTILPVRETLRMVFPALLLMGGLCLAVPEPAAAEDELDLIALTDEVAKEVEALRGWEFKTPVDRAVYSEAELRGFIEKKIAEEYTETELDQTETFLKMIGALPPDIDLIETVTKVLLSQVGGFYDPAVSSFFLIDREDVTYGPFVTRVFIAHELTHALDDQYIDLDKLMKSRERTEDGEFLVGSLVEGSATALMSLYVTKAQLSGKLDPSDLMGMMESEMERSQTFFEAPPYFQTLLGTYTCGMVFLLKGNLTALMSGGTDVAGDNLLAALEDPPLSSEQILHPDKYWDPETRDDPVRVDDAAVTKILDGMGYSVSATNTAGEALMAVITHPADRVFEPMAASMPAYWTNAAAMGWGGDRFYLLKGEEGERGLWITLWDTAKERDEFVDVYDENADAQGRRILLGDRGAVYLFGGTEAEGKNLEAALAGDALGLSHSGQPWSVTTDE